MIVSGFRVMSFSIGTMVRTDIRLQPSPSVIQTVLSWTITQSICDRVCENWPCSHLVVIRETLV